MPGPYQYAMGRFEVSEKMIDSYNAEFGTPNNRVITKDLRGPNKPATSINWNEAARFVNWLNISRGYKPAYRFHLSQITASSVLWSQSQGEQYNPENPLRNRLAVFALPSEDEWYQSAYLSFVYGPYYDYPNESNTPPIRVASGTTMNTAVYDQTSDKVQQMLKKQVPKTPYGWSDWEATSRNGKRTTGALQITLCVEEHGHPPHLTFLHRTEHLEAQAVHRTRWDFG